MIQKLILASTEYVEAHIKSFHDARLKSLQALSLDKLIKRKNPYLFRAKNLLQTADFVKALLEAHLSSQEETIFGDFMERLAIFIAGIAVNGQKSSTEGIDLEFTRDSIRHLVTIKSGPNWGNSSQISRMVQNFNKARRITQTSGGSVNVRPINGCCYGIDDTPVKNGYEKLCGQRFWELITGGDAGFYLNIIEPLSHQARERNEEFQKEYATVVNKFVATFTNHYCIDGVIDWSKIVEMSSKAGNGRGHKVKKTT